MRVDYSEKVIRERVVSIDLTVEEARALAEDLRRTASRCCEPASCDTCRPVKNLAARLLSVLGNVAT